MPGAAAGTLQVNLDGKTLTANDAGQITINPASIGPDLIAGGAITRDKIALGAVTGLQIDPAIAGAGLVKNALGNIDVNTDGATLALTGNAIGLKQNGVSTAFLADGAVTGAKIAVGTIDTLLPEQSSNAMKYLQTDGKRLIWGTPGNFNVTATPPLVIRGNNISIQTSGPCQGLYTDSGGGIAWDDPIQRSAITGEVRMLAGDNMPVSGWLSCDGQTVSKSDYSDLFNVLGFKYGGDGSSTFGIPDLNFVHTSGRFEPLTYIISTQGCPPGKR